MSPALVGPRFGDCNVVATFRLGDDSLSGGLVGLTPKSMHGLSHGQKLGKRSHR